MSIIATRHGGPCTRCGQLIQPGQECQSDGSDGWEHVSCPLFEAAS